MADEIEKLGIIEEFKSSSLMVNVDYLDLLDRVGEEETWIVLGKLKDLLG